MSIDFHSEFPLPKTVTAPADMPSFRVSRNLLIALTGRIGAAPNPRGLWFAACRAPVPFGFWTIFAVVNFGAGEEEDWSADLWLELLRSTERELDSGSRKPLQQVARDVLARRHEIEAPTRERWQRVADKLAPQVAA